MAQFSPPGLSKPGSDASLPEVNRSLPINLTGSTWRRFLSFAGPGFMVAVGYMDPGNWATDLAGGSRYGYALLWVILASNLMAILLQTMCARLGIATQKDLAQACRDYYSRPVSVILWLLCEIAIVACDVAEVIGSAVALNLLFKIPLVVGVFITGADVLVLLGVMRFGFRKVEAIILTMVGTIFACFAYNVFAARPEIAPMLVGLVKPSIPDKEALFIAVGILGATVMPHNLYLHSSIVQTRRIPENQGGKREAIRFATLDAVFALGGAFFVNAAILILAAAVFYPQHHIVEKLEDAHSLLIPLVGGGAAATLFAVALLMAGQASTITATLAGQIVMEGFMHWRVAPWMRRLATRALAIVPAAFLVAGNGDNTIGLLTITQVILSMQLPFAVFPLVAFTSSRERMGENVNPRWMAALGWMTGIVITILNVYLLWSQFGSK
ncbi:Nramp family divalent metal transporter [soil metagenome]